MTKANIYDQHRAAFSNVSAYVIGCAGERVATLAFKFPRDGAGRLYCYAHWLGLEMARGYAGGYGYDKRTAAAASAARNLPEMDTAATYSDGTPVHTANQAKAFAAFLDALRADNGHDWEWHLREAGFDVWQAV